MKHSSALILCAALAACPGAALAEEEFAPQGGDFAIELQFNPFSNNFKTFQIDQLSGRYMLNNHDALRFGVGFGVDNSKLTPSPDNSTLDSYGKTTVGNFSINLGYERHFYSHGRIDLYAGAGIGYRYDHASGKSNINYWNYDVTYHNVSIDVDNGGNVIYDDNRTAHSFRVNAFTGIDFYVYRGLYVGAELGVRFAATIYPGIYTETDNGYGIVKSEKQDRVEQLSLKAICEPALRLGWKF